VAGLFFYKKTLTAGLAVSYAQPRKGLHVVDLKKYVVSINRQQLK